MTPGELRQSRLKVIGPELDGAKATLGALAWRLANWGPHGGDGKSLDVLTLSAEVRAIAQGLEKVADAIQAAA